MIDLNELPDPVGYRMLVKPYEIEEVSKGGIVLVQESKEYAEHARNAAKVVKMGPDCYVGEKFRGPWCKVGDYVVYARHTGQRVDIKDGDDIETYLFINDDDVRGTTKFPSRIRMYL